MPILSKTFENYHVKSDKNLDTQHENNIKHVLESNDNESILSYIPPKNIQQISKLEKEIIETKADILYQYNINPSKQNLEKVYEFTITESNPRSGWG